MRNRRNNIENLNKDASAQVIDNILKNLWGGALLATGAAGVLAVSANIEPIIGLLTKIGGGIWGWAKENPKTATITAALAATAIGTKKVFDYAVSKKIDDINKSPIPLNAEIPKLDKEEIPDTKINLPNQNNKVEL